ncbi:MAG: RNA polymerase sigma factor [Chitinophagaceae bacterium]
MTFHQPAPQPFEQDIIHNLMKDGINRKKAEDQLFNHFAYFIEQAMNKYSFPEDEAFNIYADTIMVAIARITDRTFEGRSSLKTWLFQIFHNKCVDLVRKNATNKSSVHNSLSISDVLFQMADTAKLVIQEMMEKTDMERIKQKLNEIGESCRRLLLLWADGYNDKEIAAAMEYKSADVVKTSRLRCLEKLRYLYKNGIK